MKTVSTIQLFLLLLIIIEINTQNLKEKDKKLNNGIVKIPGYPSKPNDNDYPQESSQESSNPTSNPTTTPNPNPGSSRARGTSFFEISRKYYGNTGDNSTNIYLQYPEPYTGWEEDQCQNSVEQSPINIPYETDFSILKDYGNVEILSVNYNYLESGKIQ